MKSDSSLCCSICKKRRDIQTPAKHLCKSDCLLFCELCKTEIHDLLHKECDIVAVHDVTWNHPLSQTCSTHNEKMEWYCQDHKVIGCSKCIFTAHRRCDAVMTVNEYCKKQTENSSLDDMDKFLGMAFNCMERLTEACDVQDTSMQQNKDASLKSILDLRQQINIGLDKKQEEITQELISKHKAEKAKVDVSRQRCNRLKAAIKNTRDAAGTAARRGDPIKMIQLFHRGQTEIEACNNLRDEIATSATTIKHDISRLHSMSIGRILVEVKPCVMSSEIEHVQTKKKLYDSGVKKLVTINIKTSSDREDCDVRGVVMMANQTLVISDYNNRNLKLFSQHGECLNVLKILGKPHDICLVDNSTVAVAVADDDGFIGNHGCGIYIAVVKNSMITQSIVMKVPNVRIYNGIAYMDGNIFVSTQNDIYQVAMEGEVKKVATFRESCCHLVCSPNKNYTVASVSTSEEEAVAVTKLATGIQTCVVRVGLVKNAMGVDFDCQRNLYVCGNKSSNVLQVSSCGLKIRELLTSKDGIKEPRAISICGNKFVVTNQSKKDRNNVHIYQLL